jgi:transducin (beta)-like 1
MEGRLESSPHFTKHIPRGELVELLSKALLYIEVEAHWKGDSMTANCKTGFSLLEHHVCSLDPKAPPKPKPPPPRPIPAVPAKVVAEANGSTDAGAKRKASTPSTSTDDGRAEKRPRRDADDMDVEPTYSSSLSASLSSNGSKTTIPTDEPDEPDDEKGPLKNHSVQLLHGHKAEVDSL